MIASMPGTPRLPDVCEGAAGWAGRAAAAALKMAIGVVLAVGALFLALRG